MPRTLDEIALALLAAAAIAGGYLLARAEQDLHAAAAVCDTDTDCAQIDGDGSPAPR